MTLYGTLSNVENTTTKAGKNATIITLQVRENEFKSVWYFDSDKVPLAQWAALRESNIGQMAALSATEKTGDNGQKTYFGKQLPITYGMFTEPAELRESTVDEQVAAANAVDDCYDANELPEDVQVDFASLESIINAVAILSTSDAEIAKNAVKALRQLYAPETTVYIGKLGFAGQSGKIFRVTFVTPKSDPAEWNSVSFFNKNAENAAKVLHKGDNVVLIMGEKQEYNGQPSYTCRAFHKDASKKTTAK